MTTTPEPPPAPDDESGANDDRFDRRIAFGVVAALAVVGAVGPFGWHLLSNTTGGSAKAASAAAAIGGGGGGGNGSNNAAAVAPAATTTSSASPSPTAATPTTSGAAAAGAGASASCAAALGNADKVSTGTGTTATIGTWAIMATPSVNALRTDAASLNGIVISHDATAVPAAAKSLCDAVGGVGRLAAMPDAVGATAWQAALSAYVAGATDALAAINHPAYYQAAQAQIAQGGQELDALSARIIAATQH